MAQRGLELVYGLSFRAGVPVSLFWVAARKRTSVATLESLRPY